MTKRDVNLPRPIRVLYVVDSYNSPYAGTEGQLFRLVKNIDRERCDPHLLAFADTPYLGSGAFPCPVTILGRTSFSLLATWFALLVAALKLRLKGFKVAHLFFNDPALYAPIMFKMLGFKVISSRRDMGIWYTPQRLKLLRINQSFTDCIVANSQAVKALTVEQERIKEEKVLVVYNGYDDDSDADRFAHSEARPKRTSFVLGMVANLRPIKRIGDAIAAVAILRKSIPDIELRLIGNHDPRDPDIFYRQVEELGVEKEVKFLGQMKEPKKLIQEFDVALLCSESEGFSNSIIEYMQCGIPVVCSHVGGNPEIIEEGVTGYTYPVGDVGALADRILELYEGRESARKMGANAQSAVKQRFSMARMTEAHVELYRKLAEGRLGK